MRLLWLIQGFDSIRLFAVVQRACALCLVSEAVPHQLPVQHCRVRSIMLVQKELEVVTALPTQVVMSGGKYAVRHIKTRRGREDSVLLPRSASIFGRDL